MELRTSPSGEPSRVRFDLPSLHHSVSPSRTDRSSNYTLSANLPAIGILKKKSHNHLARWYNYVDSLTSTQEAVAALAAAKASKAPKGGKIAEKGDKVCSGIVREGIDGCEGRKEGSSKANHLVIFLACRSREARDRPRSPRSHRRRGRYSIPYVALPYTISRRLLRSCPISLSFSLLYSFTFHVYLFHSSRAIRIPPHRPLQSRPPQPILC